MEGDFTSIANPSVCGEIALLIVPKNDPDGKQQKPL
jgi:hypothetical protein